MNTEGLNNENVDKKKVCQDFIPRMCKKVCNLLLVAGILTGVLVGIYYYGLLLPLVIGQSIFADIGNGKTDKSNFVAVWADGALFLIVTILILWFIFVVLFVIYEWILKKWQESVEKVKTLETLKTSSATNTTNELKVDEQDGKIDDEKKEKERENEKTLLIYSQ